MPTSTLCALGSMVSARCSRLGDLDLASTARPRLGPLGLAPSARCSWHGVFGPVPSAWPSGLASSARRSPLGALDPALLARPPRLGSLYSDLSTQRSQLGPPARRSRLGPPARPPRLGALGSATRLDPLDSASSTRFSRLGTLGSALSAWPPSERSHWTGHLGPTTLDGPSSLRPSRHDLYGTKPQARLPRRVSPSASSPIGT